MSNAAVTIKSNQELSIRLSEQISKLAKVAPYVCGVGIGVLFLVNVVSLGFYVSSIAGAQLAVRLPLQETALGITAIIAGLCPLIIRAGMKGSYKGLISLSSVAGLMLGALGYIALSLI